MSTSPETLSADEQRLAELGYKQELHRGWSGFSNFAISFSIICVLAGCFTTYGQALNNGGPIGISILWPIISVLILVGVAFPMAELASAMPTSGGIYYWSSKLGGPGWGWFTGWFNLIGLVAVVASVVYVSAVFLTTLLGSDERRLHLQLRLDERPLHRARRVRPVRDHPGARPAVQRVLEPPRLDVHERLRVVERIRRRGDRADSDLRPLAPRQPLVRVHEGDQQHRVRRGSDPRRDLHLLRHPARLPADDVHDHRL